LPAWRLPLEGDAGGVHDPADQRHQRFGMTALHRLRFRGDHLAGIGIQHAGGAGIQRGVDGEDQHGERANGER